MLDQIPTSRRSRNLIIKTDYKNANFVKFSFLLYLCFLVFCSNTFLKLYILYLIQGKIASLCCMRNAGIFLVLYLIYHNIIVTVWKNHVDEMKERPLKQMHCQEVHSSRSLRIADLTPNPHTQWLRIGAQSSTWKQPISHDKYKHATHRDRR